MDGRIYQPSGKLFWPTVVLLEISVSIIVGITILPARLAIEKL